MSICFAVNDIYWAITKDVFTMVGTLVSAFGIGCAAYIGFQGLATWKRQTKGVGDHELARRVLIELYRYRESIEYVRSAAMWVNETTLAESDKAGLTSGQIRFKGTSQGYRRRIESVGAVRISLSAALLESEAVWGAELKNLFGGLYRLQNELLVYIDFYLVVIDPDEDKDKVAAYRNTLKTKRDVLYADMLDEDDEYKVEFDASLRLVELYLKEKLIR